MKLLFENVNIGIRKLTVNEDVLCHFHAGPGWSTAIITRVCMTRIV